MDLRERIIEAARKLEARGEPVTVNNLCRESGVSTYQLYKTFPGGLDEILKALREPERRREEKPYAEAFKLLMCGGSPMDLVAKLRLTPEDAEHVYQYYLKLKGIDVGLLEAEIERLRRSNEALQQKVEELEQRVRTLSSELELAYSRGYSDGCEEGYRRGSREERAEILYGFVQWLLKKLYPGLDDFKILQLFHDYYAIYEGEKLLKKLKAQLDR